MMSKSYSISKTVRDDFVPLAYNDQGGKTDATVKVVPPASRDGGGRIKTKRKEKDKHQKECEWILTSLDSETSQGLYWEDVNKIPGPNLQGGHALESMTDLAVSNHSDIFSPSLLHPRIMPMRSRTSPPSVRRPSS